MFTVSQLLCANTFRDIKCLPQSHTARRMMESEITLGSEIPLLWLELQRNKRMGCLGGPVVSLSPKKKKGDKYPREERVAAWCDFRGPK